MHSSSSIGPDTKFEQAPAKDGPPGYAVVVGGSLAGLLSSLALASAGWNVTVLERTVRHGIQGAFLRAARGRQRTMLRFDGCESPSLREIASGGADQPVEPWSQIHGRLRAAAVAEPLIDLRDGAAVREIGQHDDFAWAETSTGERFTADVLIGADGHRSVVRRHVSPETPDARYAGYLLWVGSLGEAELPEELWLPPGDNGVMEWGRGILFAHAFPGDDGSSLPGHRIASFALYDAERGPAMRRLGVVEGSVVQHSLRPQDIPADLVSEVTAGLREWPQPWSAIIRTAFRRRRVTGTPIAEFVPTRLAAGRLALVGNAAHVPTPMTGAGFDESVEDAESIRTTFAGISATTVPAALRAYEAERLRAVQRMVESGQGFSRSFAGT
ncbi:FAD-dependent monooxygenase [Curtobacterium flaccumfaciens]|uniref:FAD-dependent monooxygenase n=1 Tax=Curtobacterium flaccumfaciens TaxID=2035 RepID=UPI00343DAE40